MYWNNEVRVLKRKNKVFIWKDGLYDTIPYENYEIVNEIIKCRIDFQEVGEYFEIEEDGAYIKRLISRLIEIGFIVDNNSVFENNKRGYTITIITTNKCNLNCKHCCQDAHIEAGKSKELTTGEWLTVIDKLSDLYIDDLTITGGEPLVREDFITIAAYARKKLDTHLSLLTNGILLTNELAEKVSTIFDSVSISIDGSDAELTKIVRNADLFDTVINRIQLLKRYGVKELSLSAILPAISKVENEFVDLCRKLEVEPVLRKYSKMGRGSTGEDVILDEYKKYAEEKKLQFYNRYYMEDLQNFNLCSACIFNFTINEMGEIFPCNLLQNDEFKIGSIFDASIIERIGSFELVRNYRNFKNTECENCQYNFLCWHCISEIYELEKDKKEFQDRCSIKKQVIKRMIWGEE